MIRRSLTRFLFGVGSGVPRPDFSSRWDLRRLFKKISFWVVGSIDNSASFFKKIHLRGLTPFLSHYFYLFISISCHHRSFERSLFLFIIRRGRWSLERGRELPVVLPERRVLRGGAKEDLMDILYNAVQVWEIGAIKVFCNVCNFLKNELETGGCQSKKPVLHYKPHQSAIKLINQCENIFLYFRAPTTSNLLTVLRGKAAAVRSNPKLPNY